MHRCRDGKWQIAGRVRPTQCTCSKILKRDEEEQVEKKQEAAEVCSFSCLAATFECSFVARGLTGFRLG